MSAVTDLSRLSVEEFASRFRPEMTALGARVAYFRAGLTLSDEDVKEYVDGPIAALPPSIATALPRLEVFLVPYLEKPNGKDKHRPSAGYVVLTEPAEQKATWAICLDHGKEATLLFACRDQEVSEYHYHFYHQLAALIANRWTDDDQTQYMALLREELTNNIHGEVDEEGWHLKQALRRGKSSVKRDSKAFRVYARQSFIDTLTLYLHGICCDIDVDTGPRQLPSRYLRRRLVLLESLYPAPEGYCVFPEELSQLPAGSSRPS